MYKNHKTSLSKLKRGELEELIKNQKRLLFNAFQLTSPYVFVTKMPGEEINEEELGRAYLRYLEKLDRMSE